MYFHNLIYILFYLRLHLFKSFFDKPTENTVKENRNWNIPKIVTARQLVIIWQDFPRELFGLDRRKQNPHQAVQVLLIS